MGNDELKKKRSSRKKGEAKGRGRKVICERKTQYSREKRGETPVVKEKRAGKTEKKAQGIEKNWEPMAGVLRRTSGGRAGREEIKRT